MKRKRWKVHATFEAFWEISTGRKAARLSTKTKTKAATQTGYRGRWRPIACLEESDGEDAGCIGLVGMRSEYAEWEALHITVDSGVVGTVGPKGIAAKFPLQPIQASRKGMHYRAANDTKNAILGKPMSKGIRMRDQPLDSRCRLQT